MTAVPCDAREEALVFSSSVAAERPSVSPSPPLRLSLAFKVFANTAPDWMGSNHALQTSLFKPKARPLPLPPPPRPYSTEGPRPRGCQPIRSVRLRPSQMISQSANSERPLT